MNPDITDRFFRFRIIRIGVIFDELKEACVKGILQLVLLAFMDNEEGRILL